MQAAISFQKSPKEKMTPTFFISDFFNDPYVGRIWAFRDASRNGVSVEKSYLTPLAREKSEIIVAVVDTGVDYNHEDLKDVMWTNKDEIAGNGIDDDNNGYIDDVYGIDPLTMTLTRWQATLMARTSLALSRRLKIMVLASRASLAM